MTASPVLLALALPLLALAPEAMAQTAAGPSQPSITQSINQSVSVTLAGNTRPEAQNLANDRGIVPDSLPMEHVFLQLRRPVAQQQAVQALIDQLHDPNSSNYHHWLSAADLTDLPLAGRTVRLVVVARRFRCVTVMCVRRIFTERFDDSALAPWARRTARLDLVRQVAASRSGMRALALHGNYLPTPGRFDG